MVKLVVLYKKPADVEAFEKHYREIHTPLVQKMPGLTKLEVTRFTGSPRSAATAGSRSRGGACRCTC